MIPGWKLQDNAPDEYREGCGGCKRGRMGYHNLKW